MADLTFPDGFLWGAATAAHQIEGCNSNSDWWAAEVSGALPHASGQAADSWNRWRDDVELAVSLGHNSYRISIEWARIEPEPGRFDADAIAQYAEHLKAAKAAGLTTFVVLWHFTNPAWLAERGAWEWAEAPARFEAYVRRVVPAFAPHVDYWATLNEPNTVLWIAYVNGRWPPFARHAWHRAYRVMNANAEGHRRAYAAIKELAGVDAPVGLTMLHLWYHRCENHGAFAAPMVAAWRYFGNYRLVDLVRGSLDWLGVQYYYDTPMGTFGSDYTDAHPHRTDMGWRIVPRGLYEVVMEAWDRWRVPIIVSENGLADAADVQRARFIIDHLAWLHRAISEGADVRGYLHWSLMDNFEWADGFAPRFGLAEVDYETFERIPRPSAFVYRDIIAANGIAEGLGAELTYADGGGSLAP